MCIYNYDIYIICIQIFTAHCQVGMETHWLKGTTTVSFVERRGPICPPSDESVAHLKAFPSALLNGPQVRLVSTFRVANKRQ